LEPSFLAPEANALEKTDLYFVYTEFLNSDL
jgi:hypothetical protein